MRIEGVDRSVIEPLMPLLIEDGMGIAPEVGQWFAAFDDENRLVGCARVTEVGGYSTIDDVLVRPEYRGRGIASALLECTSGQLWLICDEDLIEFYEARGFSQATQEGFPPPLAALYETRGEWPFPTDHMHYAMVRPTKKRNYR